MVSLLYGCSIGEGTLNMFNKNEKEKIQKMTDECSNVTDSKIRIPSIFSTINSFRRFTRSVYTPLHNNDNFDACVFLTFHTSMSNSMKLRERKQHYKNHFTLYATADKLLIVRIESGLLNATVIYQSITLKKWNCSDPIGKWCVSVGTEIKYTFSRPTNSEFCEYVGIMHGEWWYFDSGIILSGISMFPNTPTVLLKNENDDDKNDAVVLCQNYSLIYFELFESLKPDAGKTKDTDSTATTVILNQMAALSTLPKKHINPDPIPNIDINYLTGRSTTYENDIYDFTYSLLDNPQYLNMNYYKQFNELKPKSIKQDENGYFPALIPSKTWFLERQKELEKGDITYFVPE